jgi:uncharacterized protein (DUF2062 family)
MFYSAYKLGKWVLGETPGEFCFELSLDWLMTELSFVWRPFLLGCLLLGTAVALVGYTAIRLYWRYLVVQKMERRRDKQRQFCKQQDIEQTLAQEDQTKPSDRQL